ncbi:alpha/beta fold hydrolase [Ectopseudomonas chengduensis]
MEPLARALADNGYRVLAPDLPGYGESATGTPRRVLSVEQLADVLDLWLSACAIDKATFIGNSYGCQILTALAVRHPQRVERLVLMASDTAPECGPPHGGHQGLLDFPAGGQRAGGRASV